MLIFLQYMTIAFVLLLAAAALISYCKRRQGRTSHGLTGMCHETGGKMCGCCSSQLQDNRSNLQSISCAEKKG